MNNYGLGSTRAARNPDDPAGLGDWKGGIEPTPGLPPPYWGSIVEFDRLVDRIAWLLEQRQERDLIRRANQSEHVLLKLQAGE